MNIQIFGTKKCNDTKKAQRYYRDRGIKFQFIDLSEKELSKGEFRSVCQTKDTHCQKRKTGDGGIPAGGMEGLDLGTV